MLSVYKIHARAPMICVCVASPDPIALALAKAALHTVPVLLLRVLPSLSVYLSIYLSISLSIFIYIYRDIHTYIYIYYTDTYMIQVVMDYKLAIVIPQCC